MVLALAVLLIICMPLVSDYAVPVRHPSTQHGLRRRVGPRAGWIELWQLFTNLHPVSASQRDRGADFFRRQNGKLGGNKSIPCLKALPLK